MNNGQMSVCNIEGILYYTLYNTSNSIQVRKKRDFSAYDLIRIHKEADLLFRNCGIMFTPYKDSLDCS